MISLSDGRYSHDSSGTFHHPFDIAKMQMSARRIKMDLDMELDMERLFLPWTWAQLEA